MYQVNFLIKVGMQKFLMRSWRGEMHLCMPVGNVCQHVSIYNQNWKTRDQCVLCCHNKHATVIRETNVNETSIDCLQFFGNYRRFLCAPRCYYNGIYRTFQRFPFRARQIGKVKKCCDGLFWFFLPSQNVLTLLLCLALKGKRWKVGQILL